MKEIADKRCKTWVDFFFELGILRKTPRSHQPRLLTCDPSDNLASHSYRVAAIAYFLAKAEGADVGKTVLMALFHDVGESRSGDLNYVNKRYTKVFEEEVAEEQVKGLVEDDELFNLTREYEKRETKESELAKDADLLDQLVLLREYEWQGNKEAARWIAGDDLHKRVQSKTAKRLGKKILETGPGEWWDDLHTHERR